MSTVTITITVQPGADVSVAGADPGSEAAAGAATPPAPLEELGSPTEGGADGAGAPPDDLEVLGEAGAESASDREPLPLEELAAEDRGLGEVAPGPMPLEDLEEAAKASSSKKGGKKDGA
jgi:hypothetical protein